MALSPGSPAATDGQRIGCGGGKVCNASITRPPERADVLDYNNVASMNSDKPRVIQASFNSADR